MHVVNDRIFIKFIQNKQELQIFKYIRFMLFLRLIVLTMATIISQLIYLLLFDSTVNHQIFLSARYSFYFTNIYHKRTSIEQIIIVALNIQKTITNNRFSSQQNYTCSIEKSAIIKKIQCNQSNQVLNINHESRYLASKKIRFVICCPESPLSFQANRQNILCKVHLFLRAINCQQDLWKNSIKETLSIDCHNITVMLAHSDRFKRHRIVVYQWDSDDDSESGLEQQQVLASDDQSISEEQGYYSLSSEQINDYQILLGQGQLDQQFNQCYQEIQRHYDFQKEQEASEENLSLGLEEPQVDQVQFFQEELGQSRIQGQELQLNDSFRLFVYENILQRPQRKKSSQNVFD